METNVCVGGAGRSFLCWENTRHSEKSQCKKNEAPCQGIINISETLYYENKR